jgi:hypothetical protein
MDAGTSHRLRNFLILVSCCVLTSFVTRFLVRAQARAECREAIDFRDYLPAMERFVQSREIAEGEMLRADLLPEDLTSAGIVMVFRRESYIIFRLPHRSILADDADTAFVYQLDQNNARAAEDIISRFSRNTVTYHVQELSKPRWLFWMYSN